MPERTTFSLVAWLVVVLDVAARPRERAADADTPGTERVLATASGSVGPPEDVVESLMKTASVHAAGEPFGDDITILCVHVSETRES